jgi:PKD repeat protein
VLIGRFFGKVLKSHPDLLSMKYHTCQLLNNAVLEVLEGRQMMSVAPLAPAVLQNGVLTVNESSAQGTRVQIDLSDNSTQLLVSVGGVHQLFQTGSVASFDIHLGGGSDYLYINPAIDIPENIKAGDGNDTIRTGWGDVTLTAGNGNDSITLKGENNYVKVGDGNDAIWGDKSNNTIIAGDGNDYIVSAGHADVVTAGNGNDTFVAGSGHDKITHGSGVDSYTGGLSNSYLYVKSPSTNPGSTGSDGGTAGTTGQKSNTGGTTSSNGGSTVKTGGTTSGSGGTTTPTVPNPITPSGGSGGSGGTTSGGGTTTPTVPTTVTGPTTPTLNPHAPRPVAVITQMAGPRITGLVVNVDGLSSTLNSGAPEDATYAWDFGDPNTQYNQMTGYNAAHVYDHPGHYTITLTVTNDQGGVSSTVTTVVIAASARSQIYVDSQSGSDGNNGSIGAPFQSLAAAFAAAGNDTEILLRAGEKFYTNASLHLTSSDVLIGRYGTGANPTIMRVKGGGLSTIDVESSANGVTLQDITLDSPYPASTVSAANKIGVGGFFLGGKNICVRDCTFLNVDDAINENGNPEGVLIQSNSAPAAIGLRAYMVWGQGGEQVIVGNYAANTTKEHIVRLVGLDMVTVEDNNFTNHDGKGCIEMHEGEYGWIVDNTVDGGDIRCGPLGLWGESASSQTDHVRIEDNQLTNTYIYVQTGTHGAMIDNNVITRAGVEDIEVDGEDSQGRVSMNVTIVNNTGIDTSSQGKFLYVAGYAQNITLKNNLWVAPQLQVGDYGAAPVYIAGNNLSDFTSISGNIWPVPESASPGVNGINDVNGDYLTAQQWDAQSKVGTDVFENLDLANTFQAKIAGQIAGAALKVAA